MAFKASKNTTNTIATAIEYARNYRIETGITLDGCIVTTRMCVNYRLKRKDLVMRFWYDHQLDKVLCECYEQERPKQKDSLPQAEDRHDNVLSSEIL